MKVFYLMAACLLSLFASAQSIVVPKTLRSDEGSLQQGSRLIVLVGMLKSPNWQINYGTGKDVSEETIEDGKIPLQIMWMNSSYIKIPLLR